MGYFLAAILPGLFGVMAIAYAVTDEPSCAVAGLPFFAVTGLLIWAGVRSEARANRPATSSVPSNVPQAQSPEGQGEDAGQSSLTDQATGAKEGDQPASSEAAPHAAQPGSSLVGGLIGIVVLGALGYWFFTEASAPSLPRITVQDEYDIVSLRGWEWDKRMASYLEARMTYKGSPTGIRPITYAVYDGRGTRVDEGTCEHPSANVGDTVLLSCGYISSAGAKRAERVEIVVQPR